MKLSTKEFKERCKIILGAVAPNKGLETKDVVYAETLSLVSNGDKLLKLKVTNLEYFVTVNFEVESEEILNASVNAASFLKLVSQFTDDTIELTVDGTNLKIKSNGTYKIPLVFENDKMLELPEIQVNSITNEMEVPATTLQSILKYNSRELELVKSCNVESHSLYYVDQQGAITFTKGACVNSFTLPKDIKMQLSPKVVKLFKLFNSDDNVKLVLSQEETEVEGLSRLVTKVGFSTDVINITSAMTTASTTLSKVPADDIRKMADAAYDYPVVLHRESLLNALNRLFLFGDGITFPSASFTVNDDHQVIIQFKDNEEIVEYSNDIAMEENYVCNMNIEDLRNLLSVCTEEYITFNFGSHKAVIITYKNIKNIVQELK